MRPKLFHIACGTILIWLLASGGCRTPSNSSGSISSSAEDEALLKQATADWDRFFNSGQTEALARLYSPDLVSMPYDVPSVHGRLAQQKAFEEFFSENENARHETTVEEMLVTNDWAIERGSYKMTYKPKKTVEQVIETGRHVMCRKKVEGKWQIVWEIWNTDKPVR
jgi:ketosteroid isomerase-like protein